MNWRFIGFETIEEKIANFCHGTLTKGYGYGDGYGDGEGDGKRTLTLFAGAGNVDGGDYNFGFGCGECLYEDLPYFGGGDGESSL